MSIENVDRFLDAVKADPSLHRSLVEANGPQELMDRAVEMGRQRGMPFTADELAAWLRGLGSGTAELDDAQLRAVSGGSISSEFLLLQNAFNNVTKSIGDGLSSVARKG
jgi:predicted ribosomally synthesized peptide with nif11-like leader